MAALSSFVADELGLLMIHYLWMGGLLGGLARLGRWMIGTATPRFRYAYSLSVFSLLMVLGTGFVVLPFLPQGSWESPIRLWDLSWPTWVFSILPVLPAVWFSVGFLLFGWLCIGTIGVWRLRGAASPLPPELRFLTDRITKNWSQSGGLVVKVCQRIAEPVVLGIYRPLILLPSTVICRCRPEQLELILLHEFAHIRRRDNLVLYVQRLGEVLFWFQPAVWMVSHWLTRDREFCCDQFVLKQTDDHRLYAETLISLADSRQPTPAVLPATPFGRDHIFARIRYILNLEEVPMSRRRVLAQVAVFGMVVSLGLFALGHRQTEAVADTKVASEKPPAKDRPPVTSQRLVVPVPASVTPQPNPLPSIYTQKPEVILQPAPPTNENPVQPNDLPPAIEIPREQEPLKLVERATSQPKRAWGPEQVEGPPDTEGAGDIQTAWASQTQDGQKEWLICEFAEAVLPSAVAVYETYNPGSLEKMTAFDEDGKEHEVWSGTDPTPRTANRGTSVIPIKTKFKIKRVKLFFDSPSVPGWNEIDAVGLRSKADENMQWAKKVTASSTFAQGMTPVQPMVVVPAMELKRLQDEVKELKAEMKRMKTMEAELKELKKLVNELNASKE